jgi:hypothetical protein
VTGPGGRVLRVGPAAASAPVAGPQDMIGFGTPAITPAGYAPRPPAAVVLIPRPTAGRYTITPDPASAPIAAVRDAEGTPLPAVPAGSVAHVAGGSSRRRTVRFHLGPLHGHTVSVVEYGKGVAHPLGSAHAGTNAITFTDGPAGPRRIVALIANDTGVATAKRTIATFVAPGPIRPGRPNVRLRRAGTKVVASWPKVAFATRYREQVTLSDGRMLQFVGRRTTLTIPAVAASVTGKVTVRAQRGAVLGTATTAKLERPRAKKKAKAKARARKKG